jgi:hypothetical protein
MVMGIAIFSSLTALITSLVIEPAKDVKNPILEKLDQLTLEMDEIKKRLGGDQALVMPAFASVIKGRVCSRITCAR